MKILFIGLGGIGQRHLRNLKQLYPESEIIAFRTIGKQAVISQDLEIISTEGLEEKYNIKSCASLEEALEHKPFATIISNPSSLHIDPAIDALKAGSHVFIEKPLSSNFNLIPELMDLSKDRELTTMVGFQLRFNPLIKKIKELLSQKFIGKILSAHVEVCEYMPWFHKYEDYKQIYAAKADLGGGVVLTQIHELDYLIYLFGQPEFIFSLGGKKSDLEIDVEDSVNVLINVEEVAISIYMDFIQKEKRRGGVIYGEKGHIEFDLINLTLNLISEEHNEEFSWHNFDRNQMFLEELKEFIECSKEARPTTIDLNEGLKSLKLAMAIKEGLVSKDKIYLNSYSLN